VSFKEKALCNSPPLPPGIKLSAVLVDSTKAGTLLVKLLGGTTKEQAVDMLTQAIRKLKE
jgi:hypothetical protein